MKLNHDCIRDLILYLEKNLELNSYINIKGLELKNYSSEDIIYTALKLEEAGFINGKAQYADGGIIYIFLVSSLTYSGHNFIDNIRDNKVWKKTKSTLSTFSSTSIAIAGEVASKVLLGMISNSL